MSARPFHFDPRARLARALFATALLGCLSLVPTSALAIDGDLPRPQSVDVWLDFDGLAHGEVVKGQLDDVTILASNFHRDFDLAVAFDTRARETADRDLEARLRGDFLWSGGNLRDEDLGRILILQENDRGCASGVCADPDDEGRRPAGDLIVSFHAPVADVGFDLIDVESLTAEHARIELFDGGVSAVVGLMDYLDPSSERYDPTIELGDNSANRFAAISAASVGLEKIDKVIFHLGGSGGLDNLHAAAIPEPSTALLMALGLGALAARRR